VTLSLPLLLDLPLFIYALFILRKAAAQERELGSAGAALSSASA
jgi:hypothetical protein